MISISAAARNSRWIALAVAAALIVAAAACGGGGAGAPPPVRVGNTTSARPCKLGLSLASSGGALETIWRPQPPPSPAPPSPQPTQTIASTVQITTSIVSNSAQFNAQTGLTQLHSDEQDATALQVIGIATDTFVACPANNAGEYRSAGWTSTDSNGVVLSVNFAAGNGLVDILPESAGAAWSNNAAAVLNEIDPSGQTQTKVINADGSYVETSNFPDGTQTVATEHSDGTATYSIPLGGPNAGPPDIINVGTPRPAPTGGPVIPIVITIPSATPQVLAVPDWYPPGPLTLAAETDQDLGSAPLPGACNVPASLATSGNKLVRTTTRFDTIFGEVERDVDTVYTVVGIGVVCTQLDNKLTAYYDYTSQGSLFSAAPQQITSLTETVGVQNVSGQSAAARKNIAVSAGLTARIDLARERFLRIVRSRHAAQLHGLHRRVVRGMGAT